MSALDPLQRDEAVPAVPTVTRIRGALVVTLPPELSEAAFRALRGPVLQRIQGTSTTALIFECSGLDLLDAGEFAALSAVARTAGLLGVRTMIVGLGAGIVSHLVHANVDTSAFTGYGSLDDALGDVPPRRAKLVPP